MLSPDDKAPDFRLPTTDGQELSLSDLRGRRVHLQFLRFAECPVCNLHVRSFAARHDELRKAGLDVVALFHTPIESLRAHMEQHQVPFTIVGDPERQAFADYGITAGPGALMSPRFMMKAMEGMASGFFPNPLTNGGILGYPADFLIDEQGIIRDAHYGSDATDSWSVDDVLDRASNAFSVVALAAK